MEIDLCSKEGKPTGKAKLPKQFNEPVRKDLIGRAVESLQSRSRQPYGAKPGAGMRASADLSRRRRKYRGSYGIGISRVPRKIMSRQGTRMNWVGAVAPGTVSGRRAHPPKAEKIFEQKINKKENRKAIRSAMAATVDKEIVAQRGHKVPEAYPFAFDTDIESLSKTKEIIAILKSAGLEKELERASVKKERAGKGKRRGRRYKKRTGPLIVVSEECKLSKASKSIPGVDVVAVNALNARLLAPGTHIGRLTIYTKPALEKIEKEGLFI